jgi:hypothetical protein
MLNDTTKPGEVLHKGGLDLLTLLHRRDVELHAHLTLWCSNDDQQRCEHFDHGFITRPSSPRLPFRGGPHDRQNIGRRRQIASSAREGNPRHARFCCGGVPGPFVRKGEQRSRYANGCDGLVFLRRKENPATAWQLVAGLTAISLNPSRSVTYAGTAVAIFSFIACQAGVTTALNADWLPDASFQFLSQPDGPRFSSPRLAGTCHGI